MVPETDIATPVISRMPTGIAGFDAIADGGLPRGGVTVVLGGAGTGKTLFGIQVLAHGAGKMQEPGILVAFEESAARIVANTSGFVWGGAALTERGVHFLDAQLSQTVEHAGEFDLIGLLAMLTAKVKQVGAQRVVFDGLDVLLAHLGTADSIRREVFRLRDWVHQSGVSAIVTAKVTTATTGAADFDFLQFMTDCLVILEHRLLQGMALRFIRVAKYRGAAHSANEFPVAITTTGLEVAQNTGIALSYPVSTERISSGVERLDTMLSGGYYRGTSVLITGVPGTAKTSLSAAFAEAAALRGERTLYISFDEAPEQIARNVASIGIQLRPHIDAGTLALHSLRGRAESPKAHVAHIRSLLSEFQAQNLVVDPISALAQHGFESVGETAALQILDLAKSAGITVVFTSLLGSSAPLTEQTPISISTIADTWLHVSNVIQGGERNRSLTIIKSRGMGHSNQVRELVLSNEGITLADVYSAGGEVLMGTLRWEKENEARRARAMAHDDAVLREKRAELALAETKASVATLLQTQAIRESELLQQRAHGLAASDSRVAEDAQLLERRHADQATTSATHTKDSARQQ
jgi:circadian clock protein KaiC